MSAFISAAIFLVIFFAPLVGCFWLTKKLKFQKKVAEQEAIRIHSESQQIIEQQILATQQENQRVKDHYETEVRQIRSELEPLRQYQGIKDAETKVQGLLADALREATTLREQASVII